MVPLHHAQLLLVATSKSYVSLKYEMEVGADLQ